MAVDQFLKIEGKDLKGEAEDKGHKGDIDVLAWSFGASQSGTTHMGKGGGAGKVNVGDISVTKYVDSATHALFEACCKGTHYEKMTLTVRKAGDTPLEYLVIIMHDVIITSVSTGGSSGEDRLTENVTLNFSKVQVKYTPQNEDGAGAAVKEMGWDIAANIPM